MRNIYLLTLKSAFLLAILFGGLSYGQLYVIAPENINAKDVSDNGVVTISSTAENFMWTEAGGLVTINTISNGYSNAGNPKVSNDGTKISATVTNPATNLNEVGVYDVATGTWTYLGGIGGQSDGSSASAWGLSGDGSTIVGLGWVNAGSAHAIKRTVAGGMVDMGSTVAGSSSRANDASFDGSVIVGWQDSDIGYRQGAIWDADGNQTLIFDNNGFEVDEASAVSDDGQWVVGGGYENQAWIWNETSGLLAIPHPNSGMFFRGASTAVNQDGSVVVGYYRAWPGPAAFGEGFIWTEANGRVALNDYVDGLGIDRQGVSLNLPLGISPDGTMIVGNGINASNTIVAFMVKLPGATGDCEAVDVPYYQDFETAVAPDMPECTSIENAGTGNDWETYTGTDGDFSGTYLRYRWNASNSANAWFYTQGINLTAGTDYKITYDYGTESAGTFPENLKVAYGTSAEHTAMTTVLADHPGIATSEDAITNEVIFTPDTDGVYYFGFNSYSAANMFYLYVDNIKVELASDEPGEDYCEPVLDCTDGDLITNVTFEGINNDTDCSQNGYGNYTDQSANVVAGEAYPISVTVGDGWAYESVSVWIDYDNSFTFDENEFTYIGTGSAGPVTGTVSIPADVAEGSYRMRVRVAAVGEGTATWDMACDEDQGYGETEDYTVIVGEGSTGDGCSQEFTGETHNGAGFIHSSTAHYIVANDVVVEGGTQFTFEKITLQVVSLGGTPTTFDVAVYEDEDGSVGNQIGTTQEAITAVVTPNGTFGSTSYPQWTVELTLPTSVILTSNGSEDAHYWIGVSGAPDSTNANVYWVSYLYTENPDSYPSWQSPDGGASWAVFTDDNGANIEGMMLVEGTCETLGLSDMTSFDFAYYPNPVKDVLNITSDKTIESLSVFNLAGQEVLSNTKVSNGQVNISALPAGVYVFKARLQGGQVETFKIIKK